MSDKKKSAKKSNAAQLSKEHHRADDSQLRAQLHLRVGWWSLLVFLTLGIVLEGLHALKADLYVHVSNETRRLMWTLAHAHGTLMAFINFAFCGTLLRLSAWTSTSRTVASRSLLASTLLLPLGFFLGGVVIYSGDPGLGILLVPFGALLLLLSVLLTARAIQ